MTKSPFTKSRWPSKKRISRRMPQAERGRFGSGIIIFDVKDICQAFNRLVRHHFRGLGPGLRSRAKYSLTAFSVVNHIGLSILLPQSSALRIKYARCSWVSPLISAAFRRGISSSSLGWSSLFSWSLPGIWRQSPAFFSFLRFFVCLLLLSEFARDYFADLVV